LIDEKKNSLEVKLDKDSSSSSDTWIGTSARTALYDWSTTFLPEGYKGGIHKVKVSIGYYFTEDANTEVWIGSPTADMIYDFDYIQESPNPNFATEI
jgi:hypothetical protein